MATHSKVKQFPDQYVNLNLAPDDLTNRVSDLTKRYLGARSQGSVLQAIERKGIEIPSLQRNLGKFINGHYTQWPSGKDMLIERVNNFMTGLAHVWYELGVRNNEHTIRAVRISQYGKYFKYPPTMPEEESQ